MDPAARLLVIDDTPQNGRLLEAMLTPHGYTVTLALSGSEGLEKLHSEPPDLVLLDILMPDMTGYDVCRRIREDPTTHLLPVVMLTSSGEQDKVNAIEAGADDFIGRPSPIGSVVAKPNTVVSYSTRRRAIYGPDQAGGADRGRSRPRSRNVGLRRRTLGAHRSGRSPLQPPKVSSTGQRTPATSAIDALTAVPGAQPRRAAVGGSTIMRRVPLILAMVASGVVVAACGSDPSATPPAAQTTLQKQADMYQIDQIEVTWHKAASIKDLNLMMTIWAANATFQISTHTYSGTDQIRSFWAKAAPFQTKNVWVDETPAYKARITVSGNTGTLYFECHFVDVPTRMLVAVVATQLDVARISGRWLITSSISSTPILTP